MIEEIAAWNYTQYKLENVSSDFGIPLLYRNCGTLLDSLD